MNRNELIQNMRDAYNDALPKPIAYAADVKRAWEVALDVAVTAILDKVSDEEWAAFIKRPYEHRHLNALLASRRALFSKPVTPEDRVRMQSDALHEFSVWLDGKRECGGFADIEDAKIYKLGLIAQLKEKP